MRAVFNSRWLWGGTPKSLTWKLNLAVADLGLSYVLKIFFINSSKYFACIIAN